MTARECLAAMLSDPEHYQRAVNVLLDELRRASPEQREAMIAAPLASSGRFEGLLAAVVSALCREAGAAPPPWVGFVNSPTPFFAFPAHSLALRLRLMVESPPPFFVRNVFVPANYLSRA